MTSVANANLDKAGDAPAQAKIDTVGDASTTPDVSQPWSELGLKADEYERIREILGRRPTIAELAMYSVMWSEHCSYKSSKVHLAQFSENTTDEMNEKLLVGIGENAGVVDVGDGWAVPSRSRATTTRHTSSPTRVPQPASAASSATLCRWVPGRLRSWTRCGSAP